MNPSFNHISVPPSSPRIRSRGKDIISNGILGPVAENEMIDLTCDTVGGLCSLSMFLSLSSLEKFFLGHPIPDLTWWLDGNMIDSSYYLAHKDTVINDLQDFKVLRYKNFAHSKLINMNMRA